MKSLVISAFVIPVLAGLATPKTGPACLLIPSTHDSVEYAIITEEYLLKYDMPGVKFAELTDDDILTIDSLLKKCIEKYNPRQQRGLDSLRKLRPGFTFKANDFLIDTRRYKRQYVPVIDENGEKRVLVNCFCHVPAYRDWKKSFIDVRDGGNCFFNVTINLTKKTWGFLQVNDSV